MSAEAGGGRAIPHGVQEAIEQQRIQLMRASTVLTCLWIASLYQRWHDVEIDAADVALIVRRMIDDAAAALDTVVLARAAGQPDAGIAPDRGTAPNDDPDRD